MILHLSHSMREHHLPELLKRLSGAINIHLGSGLHHFDVSLRAFDLRLDQFRVRIDHYSDGLVNSDILESFDQQLGNHPVLQAGYIDHIGLRIANESHRLNVASPQEDNSDKHHGKNQRRQELNTKLPPALRGRSRNGGKFIFFHGHSSDSSSAIMLVTRETPVISRSSVRRSSTRLESRRSNR